MKAIDLSGNKITEFGLKVIIKLALLENTSIIAFDARLNPGCTEKIQRQFALVMLKNIERLRARGTSINPEWLIPELYSFQIPPAVLKGLGLLAPGEVPKKRLRAKSKQDKRTLSQDTKDTKETQNNLSLGDNADFSQINILDQDGESKIMPAQSR
jgi:hypothetical protein